MHEGSGYFLTAVHVCTYIFVVTRDDQTDLPCCLGFINHCLMGVGIVSNSRKAQGQKKEITLHKGEALQTTPSLNNGSATE